VRGRNIPNKNKPYSIVNTNNETGEHWLGAYTEDGTTVYVYDTFARNLKNKIKIGMTSPK
jgi:hypothetical protein